MKIPLNYQITEYDCCQTSFLNALSFLFEREEIPVYVLKIIYFNTLDLDEYGTSKESVIKIINLLNDYSKKYKFNLNCKILNKEEINLESFIKYLNKNGIILIRCYQGVEHYVIITKINKKYVYIFDPYYIKCKKYKDNNFKIILSKPFNYNRKVKVNRVFSETKKDFSLGKTHIRQCILINKI